MVTLKDLSNLKPRRAVSKTKTYKSCRNVPEMVGKPVVFVVLESPYQGQDTLVLSAAAAAACKTKEDYQALAVTLSDTEDGQGQAYGLQKAPSYEVDMDLF